MAFKLCYILSGTNLVSKATLPKLIVFLFSTIKVFHLLLSIESLSLHDGQLLETRHHGDN